jgi:hypothetical protein
MPTEERFEPVTSGAAREPFLVVVHDVSPVHSHEIQLVAGALEPLVGRNISAAVVPNWDGIRFEVENSFGDWVARNFGEVLLHGWTHRRSAGRGIIAYCTNRSDEFAGLTRKETNTRLRLGQDQLKTLFGGRATGFVAPAWQRGLIDRKTLCRHGLEFLFGYLAIEFADGRRVPISTVNWDVGRFGRLGSVAESLGCALDWVRRRSIRCLAAHPVDISRGYLPRIVGTVESWLQSGGIPILPSELLRLANVGPDR